MRIFHRLATTPLIRADKSKSKIVRATTFVDELKIQVRGGKGGDGCIAFTKIFGNEFAGPDGGNGGNGGHVIFKPNKNISSLAHIPTIIKGADGESGSPSNCDGRNGEHTIVEIPQGTLVRNAETDELIIDLMDQSFLAARGGLGGKGNKFFASPINQSPKVCEYGSPGEIIDYSLEMATIAHVGLIGYPNAGKSTLLSAITRARPKVASYPFTTLRANVGIIPFSDYTQIRNIPGLIDGAWQNKGLGHKFLRHIQRCLCLVYIVDLSWDPEKQLKSLQNEVKMYNPKLLEKPSLIVGNKIDLPDAKHNALLFKTDLNISGKHSQNLKELIVKIRRFYEQNVESLKEI